MINKVKKGKYMDCDKLLNDINPLIESVKEDYFSQAIEIIEKMMENNNLITILDCLYSNNNADGIASLIILINHSKILKNKEKEICEYVIKNGFNFINKLNEEILVRLLHTNDTICIENIFNYISENLSKFKNNLKEKIIWFGLEYDRQEFLKLNENELKKIIKNSIKKILKDENENLDVFEEYDEDVIYQITEKLIKFSLPENIRKVIFTSIIEILAEQRFDKQFSNDVLYDIIMNDRLKIDDLLNYFDGIDEKIFLKLLKKYFNDIDVDSFEAGYCYLIFLYLFNDFPDFIKKWNDEKLFLFFQMILNTIYDEEYKLKKLIKNFFEYVEKNKWACRILAKLIYEMEDDEVKKEYIELIKNKSKKCDETLGLDSDNIFDVFEI